MKYDIIVIGSCTAGIYFAKRMAEQGYKVLVAEKDKEEDCGKRLNIFHMDLGELKSYGAPVPQDGDEDFVHHFNFSASRSALGHWEKYHEHTVYVMKLPLYVKRLIKWAKEFGVDFSFETSFSDFIYDDNRKIVGAKLIKDGKESEINSRLVADCSGQNSVARSKLPDEDICENFKITDKDKFYVTIHYIKFKHPEHTKIRHTISWPYYKVWIAPQEDENGAILGVGANLSFDYGDKCLEKFLENIKIPEYEIIKTERGLTPYCRPPYSFVSDGFVSLGDSSCITKPSNGEGITAAWYLVNIAAEEIGEAMKNDAYPTAENMWNINKRYQSTQGAEFADTLATMTGAVDCSPEENDYQFKNNIIFKDNLKNTVKDSKKDKNQLINGLLKGVLSGNIRFKTVKKLFHYASIAGKIKHQYKNFPDIANYDEWKKATDELWIQAGSMSDVIYDENYYLNNL